MEQATTVLAAAASTCLQDALWNRAARVIDRHLLRHVAAAGMYPTDLEIDIVEGEHPDRPGQPALRIAMGAGDVRCSTWMDWNGTLSWGRPRTWLDRRVMREIARRRWMIAMEHGDAGPLAAPFDQRSVDPMLTVLVETGRLSMDRLMSAGVRGLSVRYAVTDGSNGFRHRRDGTGRTQVVLPDVPPIDLHVDHDRVIVERMALSDDVVYRHREDESPVIRLGRCRLPHTALFSLAGRPLSALLDSPLISRHAMPVVERMRIRPSGEQEAVLRTGADGMPVVENLDERHG